MLRLNMLLLFIVVACALGTVTSQYKARKLFQALEAEQKRARGLDVEFDKLKLELSTWAAHPRIEQIARERLKMGLPGPNGQLAVAGGR